MASSRRSTDRPSPGAAGAAPSSLEPNGGAAPGVVGALLRGQPELALLIKAVHDLATLELVDDRLALVSRVTATRPAALVLPPFDADHTSTAPLVLRVRREAPGVAVVVVSGHPGGAGQPLLRVAQAGAHVLTSPSAGELHGALAALLDSRTAP